MKRGARDGFYTNPTIARGGDGERSTMQTWWKGKCNLTFVGNFPISFLYAICKELLDFAIVKNFSQKKNPLVMDTFHNIYYIMKMNLINENHNIDQVNKMHEKNNTNEIDQMMKFGWKLLLSMFMDVCW